MKKEMALLFLSLFLFLVVAGMTLANNNTNSNQIGQVQSNYSNSNQTGQENAMQLRVQNQKQEYTFKNNQGQENKVKVQENNRLRVNMSNGEQKELKLLPEVASETARQRLMMNGFNLTLKEVGNGTNMSVRYRAEGEKQVRILGLFKSNAKVYVELDSDTGEVLENKSPWWYSLSTGKNQIN